MERQGDAKALEELRVRRLTLIDQQGRVRATFGPSEDGSIELRLYDPDDRARAELAVDGNGAASLTLRAPDGEIRSCLAVGRDGETRLHLHGTAAVSLHDQEGQPRALFGLDHSGMATLSYADAGGACCLLLTEDGSGGRLHLFQHDGRGRRIPACDPGDPDASGAPTAVPHREPAPPVRGWRQTALTVGLSALLGLLGGRLGTARSSDGSPDGVYAASTVRAQQVILSDAAGNPRLRLSALLDGTPLVWMIDPTGESSLELDVSTEIGAVVRLNGGRSSITLTTPPGEQPRLRASVGDDVLFQAPFHDARYLPRDLSP